MYTGFCWGNLSESDNVEDPGLGRKIILSWICRKWDRVVDWIGLVQDKDRWRALVNAMLNLLFPYNAGGFLTSLEPVSFSRRTLLHRLSK